MKTRYIITLLLCCMLGTSIMAQKSVPIKFEESELTSQISEYLSKSTSDDGKKKEFKALMKVLEPQYASMGEGERKALVDIMTKSQKKKMRPATEVYDMLVVLTQYATDGTNLSSWMECVKFFLENKSSKLLGDFVEFSGALLKNRVLCEVKSNMWQAQAGSSFELKIENEDLYVVFPNQMELYYSSGQDNGTIYGTSGTYSYFEKMWRGEGGRVNWDRTGLPTTACWAVLDKYEVNAKLPKFTADSVMFTNTKYFQEPIMGRLEESLGRQTEPEKYTFPKFRSYQTDFELKNLLKGVDYRGSFMMNGAKFVTANEKYPATMVFYRGDNVFATISSTKVSVANNRLTAKNATVKLYLDGDSIFNNGILVRYTGSDKKLLLVNSTDRNYYSPYVNTYHNLDMFCESLQWDIDNDQLLISSVSADGRSGNTTFESSNYYSAYKYRQIQGIDQISPVMRMYHYLEDITDGYMEVNINSFARYIKMDIIQAKAMVHNLAKEGLVSYSESEGIIYVQDKLIDYVKAYNKSKKHDYDAISLYSTGVRTNAIVDLKSNDMKMYGVDSLFVSDSQQVVIYPSKGELVMKKNRMMHFDGAVHCGRFDFAVKDATFDYEEYMFDLPQINMMVFSVQKFNNPEKLQGVQSVLRNMKGSLRIDKPNNHSGLVKNEEYPIFQSEDSCYVYYDNEKLYNGAYLRDKFYYKIDPFTLNSLKDFKTDSLQFAGTFVSGGIFPDLREPLTVQRDYSLGFDMDTPEGGLPVYGGKGRYVEHLNLSNKGLRGGGKVDYLTSFSRSKNIVFLLDSMVATTDTFLVRKEGGFPDIRNGRTRQRWYPYMDSMQINQLSKGNPFQMYHGEAQLEGGVTLRPEGALGQGVTSVREGKVTSRRFELKTMEMDAKHSDFVLNSDIHHKVAYSANDMKSHIDYTDHYAEFVSNTALQRTELQLAAYVAYVDKVRWDMNRKELALANTKSEETGGLEGLSLRDRVQHKEQPGALYVCTAKETDSLQFNSTHSTYKYNTGQLSCRNVFVLNVADATIAPIADTLHIGVGGQMMPLHRSQVLASRENGYHLFYDAELIVKDVKTYGGKAVIDYVDEDEKVQKIRINDMAPNQEGITIANGYISDSANFTLNSAFGFAGKVKVEGNQQFYYFDGGVRLLHKCAPTESLGLLAYKNYLDPKNIQITVPELPTDWHGNRITASILADLGTFMPRPAFLIKERPADNEILGAHGLLMYDNDAHTYTIANVQKQENFDGVIDRYLQMNTETCIVSGEGPVSLCYRPGLTSSFSYAQAVAGPRVEDFEMKGIFGFTFPIANNIIEAIAQQLADDLRLSPASADNEMLRHAMVYHQGIEAGNANYSTYVSTGLYDRMPKEFESTMLFENLTWKYSPVVGYYTTGMTSVGAIGKKELHLSMRVMASISKAAASHVVNIYIQAARDHWYYFSYNTGSHTLTFCSSVGAIEDMVKSLSADDRQIKDKNGLVFQYKVGNAVDVTRFQTKMSRALGEEPYDAGE